MQFAFVRYTMLGNELSRHIRQKVGAIKHLPLRNQADAAKNRALLVMHAGFESCYVCIKMNTDAPWRQTTGSSYADNTGIALDEGQLV